MVPISRHEHPFSIIHHRPLSRCVFDCARAIDGPAKETETPAKRRRHHICAEATAKLRRHHAPTEATANQRRHHLGHQASAPEDRNSADDSACHLPCGPGDHVGTAPGVCAAQRDPDSSDTGHRAHSGYEQAQDIERIKAGQKDHDACGDHESAGRAAPRHRTHNGSANATDPDRTWRASASAPRLPARSGTR